MCGGGLREMCGGGLREMCGGGITRNVWRWDYEKCVEVGL